MADENIQADDFKKAPKEGGGTSGGNPLLTVILILNIVVMGAIAYFQYQNHLAIAAKEDIRDVVKQEVKALGDAETTGETGMGSEDQKGRLLALDAFTANLAQGDGPRRFIRMNPVLKFNKDSNEEEFKSRKPQIRDTIISILNSKRPEDLLKIEGKNYLKEEIKASINTFLVDGSVIDVYYVGFQIK
jgi:flagellar protein FliL